MMTPAEIARFKRELAQQRRRAAESLPCVIEGTRAWWRQVKLTRPSCCPCCGVILRRGQIAYRRAGAGCREVRCAQGAGRAA